MVSIARKTLMASVALVFAALVGLFVLFLAAAWLFQERIAFQPERPPFPSDEGMARVEYTAADGQRLFAYVVGDPENARGLLLAFHGNADLAVRQVDWAGELVHRTQMAVMIVEYRGYMGLGGKPTYETSRLDADAAFRHATESLRFPHERIALFGHSLGTAIAAELASRNPPAALVLQSPFTSAHEMSGVIMGLRLSSNAWNLVSRFHFDTRSRVASLDAPVSVSHGENDRLIPAAMGHSVFGAARVKGAWFLVPGASHNDVPEVGEELYWTWIVTALEPVWADASH